jgi:hypothetical protein
MRVLICLCLLASGVCQAQQRHFKLPECRGAGGSLQWSVKALENQILRFTVDASLVDTCNQYSDLEFVATLLDANGAAVATKRFALANVTIRGPSVRTYDFQDQSVAFAAVKGVSLNGKRRTLGGLPASNSDDPLLQEVYRLRQAFSQEKVTYPEWFSFGAADYAEMYSVSNSQMTCRSGDFSQTGTQGNPSTCLDAARLGVEAQKRREELYGTAVSQFVEHSL